MMATNEFIVLREATIDDAESIAFILRSIGDFNHINLESHEDTAKRIRTRLQDSRPSHDQIFVAVLDDMICGYGAVRWMPNLILNGIDGYLSELFIRPEYSGKKIGARIIDQFRAEAKKRGAERLWCINLKDRRSYARGFYRKMGWEEQNIAVFMEKQ